MTVSAEVEGRVGWITLDRPPENRLDAGELEELDVAVGRVAESEVAVAVIRSGSDGVFSAGADPRELLERSADENLTACRRAHQVLGRFADEAPLFVAAIAGHALGLGYEIALACDIRVAAQGRYRIGLPDVTLGLLPATGGAQAWSTGWPRPASSTRRWPLSPPPWPPAPPWPWPPSPGSSTTASSGPWTTPSTATWTS